MAKATISDEKSHRMAVGGSEKESLQREILLWVRMIMNRETTVPASLCVSIGVIPFVGVSEADSFSWEMRFCTGGSQAYLD